MRRVIVAAWAFLVVVTTMVSTAVAVGLLDPGFGDDGLILTDFGGVDYAQGVVVLADGSFVVAGTSDAGGDDDFAVAKYRADGSLDTAWGEDGVVRTDLEGGDRAYAVAEDPSGNIVVAGATPGPGDDFAVVRYLADGSLDPSFGDGGIATIDLGGNDIAFGVAALADGVVVAGLSQQGPGRDFAVARLDTAGSLDGSFGSGGTVVTDLGGDDWGFALAVQPDGSMIIAGHTNALGSPDFSLVRYLADGSLDEGFGDGGLAVTDVGGVDRGFAVALDGGGRIVLSGYSDAAQPGTVHFAVARYLADGSLDLSWGGDGTVTTSLGAVGDGSFGVAVQPDGKVIAGGTAIDADSGRDFAMVRYTTDGTLDPSFNETGVVVTDLGGAEFGNAIALRPDGTILLVGESDAAGTGDFAVAGYEPVARPPNDDFSDAEEIASGGGAFQGSTDGASLQPGEPDHAGVPGGASVWWTWMAPQDGAVSVDLSGSTFDTLLGLYTGEAVGALTAVAADDDGGTGQTSAVVDVPVVAGNDYHLAIDGRSGAAGTVSGTLVFVPAGTCNGIEPTIIALAGGITPGTPGDDVIIGSPFDDIIDGKGGDDLICGGLGDDTLTGAAGADTIFGGEGRDTLNGGSQGDHLDGGADDDLILGMNGRDVVLGGDGNDVMSGGAGDDTMFGQQGDDRIKGGGGLDELHGQGGDDTINGGPDADMIFGDAGNDRLYGFAGDDVGYGGEGNDRIIGGVGVDVLYGEAGNDTLRGNAGNDILDGGDGTDNLNGQADMDTCLGGEKVNGCELPLENTPPNIVVFLVDDLRFDDMDTAFGEILGEQSAFRRELVDEGVTVDNFFATTALCCPSRVSFLTGTYPHNHLVHGNRWDRTFGYGAYPRFFLEGGDEANLGYWLDQAGYTTGLVGKYMNGFPNPVDSPTSFLSDTHVPPGWDEWYGNFWLNPLSYSRFWVNENGTRVDYGDDEEAYLTDVQTDHAVGYIESAAAAGAPFFLWLAPAAPHSPLEPAPRHLGAHDALTPEPPPSWDEADLSDKPGHVQDGAVARTLTRFLSDWRGTHDLTLALDDMIEEVFDALERTGTLETTYVFFVSDNGALRGEHGLAGKGGPYEEAIRIPMVVRGPGLPAGSSVPHLGANIDLAPTILDLAGVGAPVGFDGESLADVLEGTVPVEEWRTGVLVELRTDLLSRPGLLGSVNNSAYPTFFGVRTATHSYVEYRTGDVELYDMTVDPYQLDSIPLVDAPGGLAGFLSDQLAALATCAGDACADAARGASAAETRFVTHCFGLLCTFTTVGLPDADAIVWDAGDGTIVDPGIGYLEHEYAAAGTYDVVMTVTIGGATLDYSVTLDVDEGDFP